MGGASKDDANDRISLWFDTKYTGDRNNRDRRILSNEGGSPEFREQLDSMIHNISFTLPKLPGPVSQATPWMIHPMTNQEEEARKSIRAQMTYDTRMVW